MGSNITKQVQKEDVENFPKENKENKFESGLTFDEQYIFQKEVEKETKKFPNYQIQKVLIFQDFKDKKDEFNPEEIKNSSKKVLNFGKMNYEEFLKNVLSKIDESFKDSIFDSIRNMEVINGFYMGNDKFTFNFSYLPFKKIIHSNEAIIHITRYDKTLECEYTIMGLTFHGHFHAYVYDDFYQQDLYVEKFEFYEQDIKWSQWKDLCQVNTHPYIFNDEIVTANIGTKRCFAKDEIVFDFKHFKLRFKSYEPYHQDFNFEIVSDNEIEYGIFKFGSKNLFELEFNGNFKQIEFLIHNNSSRDLENWKRFNIKGNMSIIQSDIKLSATYYEASRVFKNDRFSYKMNHIGEQGMRYEYNNKIWNQSVTFYKYLDNEFETDLKTICETHKIPFKDEFHKIGAFTFRESKYHSDIGLFEIRGVIKYKDTKVVIFFALNEAKFNLEIYINNEKINLFPIIDIQCSTGNIYFKFT